MRRIRLAAVASGLMAAAVSATVGPSAAMATAVSVTVGPSAFQDTVLIRLSGDTARVRLRIPNLGERVEALAIRMPGQALRVVGVVREGESLLDARLTVGPGAYRFAVESGAPVLIDYVVTGDVRRIPLFVEGGRAELTVAHDTGTPHLLRLEADGRLEIDTDTSLPRLASVGDGAWEVRLSSVPSFVRLAPPGLLSFARVADLIALVLILAGAVWTWRTARAGG